MQHSGTKRIHDWVGKVICWKLCKRLKFDHTDTWCMHEPESVKENKMRKILWDIQIQMDYPIPAIIVYKRL